MRKDIFEGIERSEIVTFKDRLAFERDREYRFAAIQINGNKLADRDICFFKTAMEACKKILMEPLDNGKYIFCSLSLLEDDVKRILEGKVNEREPEIKKSKGLDLER